MATGIEINKTGTHIRIALGTSAGGSPTTVDVSNAHPAIYLDIESLATLISSGSFTNKVIQAVELKFYDADNSCSHMKMIVLGTTPEAA